MEWLSRTLSLLRALLINRHTDDQLHNVITKKYTNTISTTQVISYIHGLPDDTWQEPSPTDPLSLIDQVELSMAYHCEERMSRQTLLRYIHQNRLHNSLRINTMDKLMGKMREDFEMEIEEQERKMEAALAKGMDQVKEEVEGFARTYTNDKVNNELVAAKEEVKSYANSEDEKLESRIHDWHRSLMHGITLRGSNAGPDRGYVYYLGRPICSDAAEKGDVWDIKDAHVVCKMLGFSRATQSYYDICNFGDCPPAGIPFGMSGFECSGSETNIAKCPHDEILSEQCNGGSGGFTGGSVDIVGVECE
jgi:hypothetical protein